MPDPFQPRRTPVFSDYGCATREASPRFQSIRVSSVQFAPSLESAGEPAAIVSPRVESERDVACLFFVATAPLPT